jgi:hypothetical protein
MLEDELVAGVQLDAWLAVNAICIQFGAESTFGPGSIAT